ncbi:YmfQ family protein [Mesorhizobium sp. 2RAF21]|uniref:YmfQ family protein n=1 Tax=Mesorhizobium sp. 2RAF21 TaxID=3232995 RepID=UPI003F94B004
MSRVVATILRSLIGKLPVGWVLAGRGGVLDALLEALAQPFADAEDEAEELMREIDPRTAVRLLPDFERVLGPDPCGRDLGNRTLAQRQRQAHQRWTARGGQSIPYFTTFAAMLGVTIQINEFWPSKAGYMRAGMRLVPNGEQFTWRVRLTLTGQWWFRAGQNQAGDRLGGFTLSDIECELRRLKPAHTQIVFSYNGA